MHRPQDRIEFKIHSEIYFLISGLTVLLICINVFNIDFYMADLIYKYSNGWQWKNAWVTSVLIHKYGKHSFILLYLFLLFDFITQGKSYPSKDEKYGKIILLSSLFLGSACVGYLKRVINVDCPWDLIRYGGEQAYHGIFNHSRLTHIGHCFPAGQSSAAFTWVSLYFYSSIYSPKKRYKILISVIVLGFVFGFSQQLRGAHFLSHDIYSLLVCLFSNIVFYLLAFRKKFDNPMLLFRVNKT